MARKKNSGSKFGIVKFFLKLIPMIVSLLLGLYWANISEVVDLISKYNNPQLNTGLGYVIALLAFLNIILLLLRK
mgnify:CR=1 FL=1